MPAKKTATHRRVPKTTDEHKAALAAGREDARQVKAYLEALGSTAPKRRGRRWTKDSIASRLGQIEALLNLRLGTRPQGDSRPGLRRGLPPSCPLVEAPSLQSDRRAIRPRFRTRLAAAVDANDTCTPGDRRENEDRPECCRS
jgi:hypothetical protein